MTPITKPPISVAGRAQYEYQDRFRLGTVLVAFVHRPACLIQDDRTGMVRLIYNKDIVPISEEQHGN